MNREIKFRAWDKKNKEMINDIAIYPEYDWVVQSDNDALCERERAEDGQIILMQYTGLKDKNGKEIYEGDIVKFDTTWNEKDWENIIGEVRFNEGCFVITDKNGNHYEEVRHTDEIEIIGNIYENKELLTNKQL